MYYLSLPIFCLAMRSQLSILQQHFNQQTQHFGSSNKLPKDYFFSFIIKSPSHVQFAIKFCVFCFFLHSNLRFFKQLNSLSIAEFELLLFQWQQSRLVVFRKFVQLLSSLTMLQVLDESL